MSRAGDSVILEEQLDENYEPSNEEILEYALWLGMDVQREANLVWIAREGLKAPLPEHWKPCRMPDNDIYYFNFQTGESTWDHPCDEFYRRLYTEEKKKHDWRVQRGLPPTASPPPSLRQPNEASHRRLPALPDREYGIHPDGPQTYGPNGRSPDQRWEGGMRANQSQVLQDASPPTSRRPSRDDGAHAAGGQMWPRPASPTPHHDIPVTKYELYSQRQVQTRPDRPASTPQKPGPDKNWEHEGRPPVFRANNPQQSPHISQRTSPNGTPWTSNSNPNSVSRGGDWGTHPQAPRLVNSAGPSPHTASPIASIPFRNGAVVNPWSDSDTTDDEENLGKSNPGALSDQKRRPSKSPAVPEEHIAKAQEAAYRREFLAQQRVEREKWVQDAEQKDHAAREEWQRNMTKDNNEWKMKRRDSMIQERRELEADYNEQLARLKSPAEAAKAQVDALLRDAEADAEERKEELLDEARRSAEDAKRAMLQQARNEVEGEKQRLMQMLRKEMEPPSLQYSQDERSDDPNDKVNRWKAIMQEDSARQREALEDKVAQDMAGEEAHMLETERLHVQRLFQDRTAAIEAQLRIDEEEFYGQRRQELEERIQQRMAEEEEAVMQRKRAELDASLSRALEKEKGDREISMRFELEKEMQAKRKGLKAEIEKKHQVDSSDSGSPSGLMANLLPGQQVTEAQTLETERAQMVERVRATIAKEEEQLLREQREVLSERVKRTLSEEAGEKSGGPVEDKRMSEGENKPPEKYALDRSLSMEGLQEGLRDDLAQGSEGGAVRDEVARVEGDGRARLARVKEEVERQVRGAREKELTEWETRTRAELEAEKERRVAQMRAEVEMLVKFERLKLAKQREKDVAEAKRASEGDQPSAASDAWKATELEIRAANEKAVAELRAEHGRAVEQLEVGHKSARLELVAEKEALQQELGRTREQLESREAVTTSAEPVTVSEGVQQELEQVEREAREKLEAARKKLEEDLAEFQRTAEEELRAVREKVEQDRAGEEQKAREAMEADVAERTRKNKRRMDEDERKKVAETKKEMKARQEFLRAKMEVELEREMKREREKRTEALRAEMEAQQQEKRSQAEKEWRSEVARIEADAATDLRSLKATKRKELKEDREWLDQEMSAELDQAREEFERAKELRLERLKRETQEEIEREEAHAEERKAERVRQLERTLQDLERNNAVAIEEARRKAARASPLGLVSACGPFAVKQQGGSQPGSPSRNFPIRPQPPGAGKAPVFGVGRPGLVPAESEAEQANDWEKARAEAEAERIALLRQVEREASAKKLEFLSHTQQMLEERAQRDGANARMVQSWQAQSEGGTPFQGEGPHMESDESQVTWPNPIGRSMPAGVGKMGRTENQRQFQGHSDDDESVASAPQLGRVRPSGGGLQNTTAQLMDDLRREKSTSPERMRRDGLEAGSVTSAGNGGGNGGGPRDRSPGLWSNVLDAQNAREGNVDMRLGRVKTRVPVSGEAPMVLITWQDAQTPPALASITPEKFKDSNAEVGQNDRGLPLQSPIAAEPSSGSPSMTPSPTGNPSPQLLDQLSFGPDVTSLPTPKCAPTRPVDNSKPGVFETEANLKTTNRGAEKGSDGPRNQTLEGASLSDIPGDIPRERIPELAPHGSIQEQPFGGLSAAFPMSPPGGESFAGKALPLESSGEGMEISPVEDFDDMESLASTVVSARVGVSDAGRRAWEENFADTGPVRGRSLPPQRPEEGPSLPRASLPIGAKAKTFLSLQRKFLRERQLIIEQARADWKMRVLELDQVPDSEDRRRKRGLLMQLKLTLEDSAHRVNEGARQMRALKHELWGEPTPSPVIPVFRTTLPARTSGTHRRWSGPEEAERPRTADGERRQRTTSAAATSESVRNNPRPVPEGRDPLLERLMGLLARWNDEHQIASDVAQEHNRWVNAFRERLHLVGGLPTAGVPSKS